MDKIVALQNLLNRTASEEEIQLLKQLLSSGEISIGGNVNHSVVIIGSGNTVELSPEALDRLNARPLLGNLDRDLTGPEIALGLQRLETELQFRAPILLVPFQEQARRLRATLKTSSTSLSDSARKEFIEALAMINGLCTEALDISFNALSLGEEPPEYDSRSPFRGLESFRPEDSEFFFGREVLTNKLVQKIQSYSFLAVLGASGSGKSSLVMEGLIPALGLDYAIFRPGTDPLSEFESAKEKALIVVDQFEELFTLTQDEAIQADFIEKILSLTKQSRIILTLRSDFLGEVAAHRALNEAVQNHLENIPPMNTDELRRAIEGQAARVALRFEADLSQQILDDVEGEPGAMPLLQHALWELWNRRHGRWLKASEYRAFGGVRQAIASTAEQVFSICTALERERMRDIFLRLTRLDDDITTNLHRDTRRRVLIRDLIPVGSDPTATILLLDKLANARLVVKTETEVEVAHETLIQHWDRLKDWVESQRKDLIVYQHLRQSTRDWAQANRAPDLLYPPSRLKQVEGLGKSGYSLNADEAAFVESSYINRKRQRLQKFAFWTIALILTGIIIVVFPLRLAYIAILPQRVIQASPMVELKGGNITFGTDDPARFSDEPMAEPKFVDTFSMEVTEVTNTNYRSCVQAGICKEPKDTTEYENPSYNNHPVVQVTFDQAVTYCAWLGRRLPDTYEWERAARGLAEEERLWTWGSTPPTKEKANIIIQPESNAEWYIPEGTVPVGQLTDGATPEGVFDLVGNVWEWTSTSQEEGVYILRGGSYDSTMERITKIRVSVKDRPSPDQAVGFRCVQ